MIKEKQPTDVLLSQIDDRIQYLSDIMAGGGMKNFEEYRCTVGKISGLTEARTLITSLVNEIEEDNE